MTLKLVTPNVDVTDARIRGHIRALIALLIGEQDRVFEQPQLLRRSDLALDMRDAEGQVLEALYYCSAEQLPPTRNNVVEYLTISRKLENAAEFVDTLLVENQDEQFGIRPLSNFIQIWLREHRLKHQGELISRIADDPYMDYADKWDQAFNLLMTVSPTDSFVYEDIDEDEFKALTYKRNQEVIALRKAGMDVSPQLPFAAAKAYLPGVRWGEITNVIGSEGSGKSTQLQIQAEHIAWKQKLNCDFVTFSLETTLDVLSQRQFARHRYIPISMIEDGEIDLASERWRPMWDAWIEETKQRSSENGYIRYFYAPGATVHELSASMLRCSEASRLLNRNICFGIDHLHSIDWEATHGHMSEFNALRSIYLHLARVINQIGTRVKTHLFLMAQQGDTRGQMFGNKFAAKRAQLVLVLQRDRFGEADKDGNYPLAQEDKTMVIPARALKPKQRESRWFRQDKSNPDQYICLDALGNPRYWYRKGDEYKHTASLRITKANNAPLGVIRLEWEARLNRITQDNEQMKELRAAKLIPPEESRE